LEDDVMTNKELADALTTTTAKTFGPSINVMEEAARRLRELPDPTPQPMTLRWLVEKHECLSNHLCIPPYPDPRMPWAWDLDGVRMWLTDSAALTVVRGIVAGLCIEVRRTRGGCWGYKPYVVEPIGKAARDLGTWIVWEDSCHCAANDIPTELEAIDALLRAMEASA